MRVRIFSGNRLFFLSRRLPEPLLGLDIHPSAAKLVELSRNRDGRHVLEHCAIEAMEPGWIVDGRVEKFDAVAEVLRRLLRRVNTRTVNVAMALPAAAVITKRISLPAGGPATDMRELDARVRAEAGLAIPLPLEDVYLDYSVMNAASGQTGQSPWAVTAQADAKTEVLLVATRRERVQDLQGLAEAAGLEPVIVDVESYAARRAAGRLIERLAQDEACIAEEPRVAMFEFGTHSTRLQILQGDEVIHERDHPFGTAALTDRMALQYKLSSDAVENCRRSGDWPAGYEQNVLQPCVAQTAQDMASALDFFRAGTSQGEVHAVLLAGSAAMLVGLSEVVVGQFGCPCRLANPFEGMDIGRALLRQIGGERPDRQLNQHLGLEAPTYLTACGLALRKFMP